MKVESTRRFSAAFPRRAWALAWVAWLSACGGSSNSPSAPSAVPTPAPSVGATLTIASGLSGQPLAGVPVTSQGSTILTDANGRVTLPSSASVGSPLDIVAPTFFDRQTTLKSSGETTFLWPRVFNSGAGESYTARLAYTSTAEGAVEGAAPLRRLVPGFSNAWVYLPPEIKTDAAVQALQQAIAWVNDVTQGAPTYQLVFEKPAGTQIVFEVSVDGTQSLCQGNVIAFFRTLLVSTANNSEIYAGLVNLCDVKWTRDPSVLAHELGHSLGLNHSARTVDVMYPVAVGHQAFTGEEKLIVFRSKQRRGGNRYPDTDRAAQAAGAQAANEDIVCGR